MARLRHIAVCVSDLDKAAEFYSKVFEFKRIGREDLDIGSAVYMSDGVINMALLNFKGKGGSAASDIKAGDFSVQSVKKISANAIAALTGERIRTMPFSRAGYVL